MPARKPNSVNEYVRRTYVGLDEENFQSYHNLVSKLRSRARARGFNPSDLTQEQFDIVNSDTLEPLEKGEKFSSKWENSSMAKAMVRDGEMYIKDILEYFNKTVVNGSPSEDGENYLLIPSTVKYLARSIKWGNNYLLKASMLDSECIDILKKKLEDESIKADCKLIEDCTTII